MRAFHALLASFALLAYQSPTYAQAASCAVLDSDMGIDDLRAMSLLLNRYDHWVAITTEGLSRPGPGAAALERFLELSSFHGSITLLEGQSSSEPPNLAWLPKLRASFETLNHFESGAAPTESHRPSPTQFDWGGFLSRCGRVDVFVLAPWSSFESYWPSLAAKHPRVFVQGADPGDVSPVRSPGFNCIYDRKACSEAISELTRSHASLHFVDVPQRTASPYAPTIEMFGIASSHGFAKSLRVIHEADPSTWKAAGTQMWDDSVAVYALSPHAFKRVGRHFEPKVSPERFRRIWKSLLQIRKK